MPISVLCPGCKARFDVSDKFAGKKGPCPKCKTVITVPDAPKPEIQVHAPEGFAEGGKDAKGRLITKPVPRTDTKVKPAVVAGIIVGSVLTLALAIVARSMANKVPVIVLGLAALGPPLAVGGYFFLRNDELEPYQGKPLWLRAVICSTGYGLLWGVYAAAHANGLLTGDVYQWVFAAPMFGVAGGGIALAAFDLEFGVGTLHYCFYLVVTLLLRAAIGLPPLWVATSA